MRSLVAFLGTFCMVVVSCQMLAVAALFATGSLDQARIARLVELWTEDECDTCWPCDDAMTSEHIAGRSAQTDSPPRR